MSKNTTLLRKFLLKAGMDISPKKILIITLISAAGISLVGTIILSIGFLSQGIPLRYLSLLLFIGFLSLFAIALFLLWLLIYIFLDLQVLKRHLDVERVLPDYLQLTAANLRSGMTPDQAMWHAVRPQFGVLSKEIEYVAKQTFAGKPLEESLNEFAERYDSKLLRYAINLINEGLEAGSELGDILNKVAVSIQEARILQKEMSANVTSYAIFIGAAVLFGSPLLLALSFQILTVVSSLTSGISIPANVQGSFFSVSGTSISSRDYLIFANTMISITSIMSAMIVSMIIKGNVKEGLKYIAIFWPLSLIIFWVFVWIFSSLMGSILLV